MKKIFTCFLALLLGIGSAWATNYTTSFNWNTDMYSNRGEASHPSLDISVWLFAVSKNYQTTGTAGVPVAQFYLTFSKSGGEQDYGSMSFAPEGTYNFSSATTWDQFVSGGVGKKCIIVNSSYATFFAPTSMSTTFNPTSGTITVSQGANGQPYVYISCKYTSGKTTHNFTYTVGEELEYAITTSVSPAGAGVVSGAGNYKKSQNSVTLNVTSTTPGYRFVKWTKGGVQQSTNKSYQFNATADGEYVAEFEELPTHTITATAPNGSISGKVDGSTTFVSGSQYYEGSTIAFTAQQKVGDYIFRRWEEGGTSLSTDLAYNFTVGTTDRNIVAVYEPIQSYTVTINSADHGHVTGSSAGSYQEQTQLTLTAVPDDGYTIDKWTVNVGGSETIYKGKTLNLTVTGNTTITPSFKEGTGDLIFENGTKTENQQGNSSQKQKNFVLTGSDTNNNSITLTSAWGSKASSPKSPWTTNNSNNYSGVTVALTVDGQAINLTSQSITVTKIDNNTFKMDKTFSSNGEDYHVVLTINIPITSDQTSDLSGINLTNFTSVTQNSGALQFQANNGTSTGNYNAYVTFVVPTAAYNAKYIPSGTYAIASTGTAYVKQGTSISSNVPTPSGIRKKQSSNSYQSWVYRLGEVEVINPNQTSQPLFVQVTAKNSNLKNCGFTFPSATKPAQYNVTVSGEGVTMQSAEDGAAQTGTKTYYAGTILTLSAPAPESGYRLKGWSINSGAAQKLTDNKWTVNGAATIEAVFELIPYYTISTSATNGTITGVLTGTQTAFVSGESYLDGTQITLTVSPNDGYQFTNWSDNNTSNPRTITVNGGAATYTAIFAKVYTITANRNDETLGTVTGAGDKLEGSSCTLTATPATNCQFVAWKDANGTTVGTNKSYTFTVSASATYTAYFKKVTALNLGSIDLVDNTGSVNTKYIQIEGTSGNYQASIRINTSAIAGTYANTDFNLAKSSLKKSGAAVTLTSASGKVTLSNGTYSISLTLIENEKSEYTVTATYTPCVGESAGTALGTPGWGSFTNDAVTMNELSVSAFYHGASSTFAHLHVKNSSNQYVQLNFWVDANHRHTYTNGVGPQPGTYPLATTSFKVENSKGYWYIDKSKQNSCAADYYYDSKYSYGIAPMSSVATTTGAAPTSSGQCIQFNGSTLYVEEGLDGKIYVRCVNGSTLLFNIGAPREASHVINAYVEGEGSVSMTGSCPYNNNEVVTLTPTPAEGYEFTGWSGADASAINQDNQLTVNGKDYNVIANFVQTVAKHHVTFKNGTTVLQEDDVEEGVNPAYEGETPTKDATAQFEYTFTGWNDGTTSYAKDATLPAVGSDDVIYTATFSESTRQYEVTINTPTNGTIKVKNDNTEVHTGDKVDYGTVLTVAATADDHYHFDAWTNDGAESVTVNAAKTIGATFAINTHKLTWVTDGDALTGDYTVGDAIAYGTDIVEPNTPTKVGYTFTGWSPEVAATMPDEDATYTAQWEEASTFTLEDQHNAGETYYATLTSLVDASRTVTYNRTFQGGTAETPYWNVFSLPFDYLLAGSSHPFAGKVLDLSSATYDAVNDEVTLNFLYETYQIEANKPYALINKGGDIVDPVFEDVTFMALGENTYSVPCTTGGEVTFVNTTCRQKMDEGNRNILFIGNNQLLYPGAEAYLRAFRGYFWLENVLPQNAAPKRVRLMIEGESVATGLSTEFAPEVQSAKRIEDGVLIIERNGNRYDAQGKEMK